MRKSIQSVFLLISIFICFLLLFAGCAAGDETVESTHETTVPTETEFTWPSNYLMNDRASFSDGKRYEWGETAAAYPVLGSSLQRGQVRSVTFLNTLADAPEDAWDVSAAGDGSVLAWSAENGELFDLFIAAEGGVYSTDSCETLFTGYVNAEQITFGGHFHTEHAASFAHMFLGCEKLTQVDVHTLDTSAALDLRGLFYGCGSLEELDLTGLNTASAENLSAMFYQCKSLRALDLSGFQTTAAQDMAQMFNGCIALSELNISSLSTDQVTNLSGMFSNCRSLTELDLSHFKTASVEDMSNLFYGCMELQTLQIAGFDTSAVQNMSGMFYSCYNLQELDISGFQTSVVTDMSGMFHGCVNLDYLDLSGFDTSAVVDVSTMFLDCGAVTSKEDVAHLDFSSVQKYDSFLEGIDWQTLFDD